MSPEPKVSREQVLEALRSVEDPELHKSIVDLDMVKDIQITDGRVNVTALLTCLLYTSPSPRDLSTSRMPSSA